MYGIDGDYDHAIRVESVTPPYPFEDRAFLTDFAGNYYLRILVRSPSSGPDPLAMADVRYGYARVSPDGVVLDTLVASDAPGTSGAETGQSIAIHTPAGDRSPFPIDMLDALSPLGYLVAGLNATYAFSIPDPAGLVHVEREGFQPVDVKAGERAEWRARVAYAERRSKTSFREVPARKPAYRGLWVDSEPSPDNLGRAFASRRVRTGWAAVVLRRGARRCRTRGEPGIGCVGDRSGCARGGVRRAVEDRVGD